MKESVILFFDEFQCIGQISQYYAIEAVLRQVAQLTDKIPFVFSGSNRHLLQQLFEDKNRPFYKLCEKMILCRINAIAKKRWGKAITAQAMDMIFMCTERPPYCVNLLCARLLLGQYPDKKQVTPVWQQYMIEEQSNVDSQLDLLSKNQKKLMAVLSRAGGTAVPLGKDFVHTANIPKTTVEQVLNFLQKRDYVDKNCDGNTCVSYPLIDAVLCSE